MLDRRPHEIDELIEGPRPEIDDREIDRPEIDDRENEETINFGERIDASLWYFIIFEEIRNLTRFTLFWDQLQQDVWCKNRIETSLLENNSSPMTKNQLKNLLNALDQELVDVREVIEAIIKCGLPILGKSVQRCWVSLVELFRKNNTALPIIKEWIRDNSLINLNISERDMNDDNRRFLDLMLSMDDYHLSLVLCAIKNAIDEKRWVEPKVSKIRNQRLTDLFAMADLFFSVRSEGLQYHRYSMWSPQEDKVAKLQETVVLQEKMIEKLQSRN
ncbi:hypothetical protein ACOMHN_025648 [Nucella lapillus]